VLRTLMIVLAVLWGAAALAAQTTTGPARPTGLAAAKLGAEQLVQQGQDALAAGDYKAAKEAFYDAMLLDRGNAKALHGLGLACVGLGDLARAREYLERAVAAAPPDRALVLNFAAVQAATGQSMRAARYIVQYLTARPEPLDEPMLNALAVALYTADEQSKGNQFFRTWENFYVKYNEKLEASRPGEKRWGVQWLPAADVDRKMALRRARLGAVERLQVELAELEDSAARALAALEQRKDLYGKGQASGWSVAAARVRYEEAESRRKRKAEQVREALAAVPQMNFPTTLTVVAMDELIPPPVGPVAAVAVPPERVEPPRSVEPPKPPQVAVAPSTQPVYQLEMRMEPARPRPKRIVRYAAGFAVAPDLVVTAAAPLENARRIELEGTDGVAVPAEVVRIDKASGLALLRVRERRLPVLAVGEAPFAGGQVQCAAFPRVNVFQPGAELLSGTVKMSSDGPVLAMSVHPRLAGGPLLAGGKVVGVELATRESELGRVPVAGVEQLRAILGEEAKPVARGVFDPLTAVFQVVATAEKAE